MTQVSTSPAALARKNSAVVLRALAQIGQKPVADAIGKDVAQVSRWQAERLGEVATILAALGLKVVPISMQCFDEKTVEALLHGHKQWLKSIETPSQLAWEDDQPPE